MNPNEKPTYSTPSPSQLKEVTVDPNATTT